MAENLKIHSNIDISHQTIKNITDIDTDDEIKNRILFILDIMLMINSLLEQKARKVRLLLHDYIFIFLLLKKLLKVEKNQF